MATLYRESEGRQTGIHDKGERRFPVGLRANIDEDVQFSSYTVLRQKTEEGDLQADDYGRGFRWGFLSMVLVSGLLHLVGRRGQSPKRGNGRDRGSRRSVGTDWIVRDEITYGDYPSSPNNRRRLGQLPEVTWQPDGGRVCKGGDDAGKDERGERQVDGDLGGTLGREVKKEIFASEGAEFQMIALSTAHALVFLKGAESGGLSV
ncbi:hypothetical protein BJ322DRAFT_1020480 [Thelephora terrestris]|uniref:Uncharacterized protein n=1 Tax=Thelephora terrestris TaxID=56493 RepID=A0A9P6HGG8_9AGAM|nr:hypothetical protein BJ322DRAFT_1020480 [Thelephora terrestris]